MRFVVLQDQEENSEQPWEESIISERSLLSSSRDNKRQALSADIPVRPRLKMQFPASVSIDTLLSAGKLVRPTLTKKAVLNFERFEIETGTWKSVMTVECKVESVKFSSGAFRDAFHATILHGDKWVLKTYNQKAKNTISETMKSTVENHCRKQV